MVKDSNPVKDSTNLLVKDSCQLLVPESRDRQRKKSILKQMFPAPEHSSELTSNNSWMNQSFGGDHDYSKVRHCLLGLGKITKKRQDKSLLESQRNRKLKNLSMSVCNT